MIDELKYCKFCDKEKPIKEFVKSGFAIKNICKECNNEKYKKKYKADKNWNELKKWLEDYYDYGDYLKINYILKKMRELEGEDV